MKIAYIDPGLSSRKGHNAAMVAEFDEALVRERGHQLKVLCSARLDRRSFADLRGELHPVFRIDGYARPTRNDLLDPARLRELVDVLASDLQRAGLDDCDAILMPTTYPLHLEALARRASSLRERRIVLGMLLPSEFWAPDADGARRIDALFADSINALSAESDFFAYSETGFFRFGAQTVPMATMLPPLASSSARQVRGLADTAAPTLDAKAPVLGFFGSPFTSKGFALLAQAAQAMAAAGVTPPGQLRVRLPAGHEAACAQLCATAPWIDAQSRETTNAQYLAEMAEVDIVWAFYDPQEYGQKMSGIVPEAISLGKPLLIAEGCHAIQDFLERHAPGSFITGAYAADTAAAVLGLGAEPWLRPARCARTHAPLMQQLKSMERYLAVCGLN